MELGNDLFQKEQEWHEAFSLRIHELLEIIRQRDSDIVSLNEKLCILRDDFCYNLKILNDRDGELQTFEVEMQAIKQSMLEKIDLISELQIKLVDCEDKLQHEIKEKNVMEKSLIDKLTKKEVACQKVNRQLKISSEKWEDAYESQRQAFEQNIIMIENKMKIWKRDIELQHASSICLIRNEHYSKLEQIEHDLREKQEQIIKSKQLLKTIQDENSLLQSENTDLQIKLTDCKAVYQCEVKSIHQTYKTIEEQLREVSAQLRDRESQCSICEQVIKNILDRICPLNEHSSKTNAKTNEGNFGKDCLYQLEREVEYMYNELSKCKQEIHLLKEEIEMGKTSHECSTTKQETLLLKGPQQSHHELKPIDQTEHMIKLKHQNEILQKVIKEMKKKIKPACDENICIVESANDNNSKLIKLHELQYPNRTTETNCNWRGPEEMYGSGPVPSKRIMCTHRSNEQNEFSSCDKDSSINRKQNFDSECRNTCDACEHLKEQFQFHKKFIESQVQILETKLEYLSQENEVKDDQDDDMFRISQLEKTIELLKANMMEEVQRELNQKGRKDNNNKMSFIDIRMMLLEKKLEQVTGHISKEVQFQKRDLIETINKIKSELMNSIVKKTCVIGTNQTNYEDNPKTDLKNVCGENPKSDILFTATDIPQYSNLKATNRNRKKINIRAKRADK